MNYKRIFLGISMKFCRKISLQQIFMLIPQENREWGFKGGMVKGHGLGCHVGPEMKQWTWNVIFEIYFSYFYYKIIFFSFLRYLFSQKLYFSKYFDQSNMSNIFLHTKNTFICQPFSLNGPPSRISPKIYYLQDCYRLSDENKLLFLLLYQLIVVEISLVLSPSQLW